MVEIVLASFINSADLIRTDMLVTTKQNIELHPGGTERNPIANYMFSTIGFDGTYILTVGVLGSCSALFYNVNPALLIVALKSISAIEFYYTVKNDYYSQKEFGSSTPVFAKFQIIEFSF